MARAPFPSMADKPHDALLSVRLLQKAQNENTLLGSTTDSLPQPENYPHDNEFTNERWPGVDFGT